MQEVPMVSRLMGMAPDIRDDLSALERLEMYYADASYPLQRVALAESLADIASSVTSAKDVLTRMVPLLPVMGTDGLDSVRQALVKQLGPFTQLLNCTVGEDAHEAIVGVIIPLYFSILQDENLDVRQSAISSFPTLLNALQPEMLTDILSHLFGWIDEELSSPQEHCKEVALELLLKCGVHFGRDTCQWKIIPRVEPFKDDPSILMRIALAQHIASLMEAVGQDVATAMLLPCFHEICLRDKTVNVKRMCAEMLAAVTPTVLPRCRAREMMECYHHLSHDPSKFVRVAAGKSLGRMMAYLEPLDITPEIVKQYVAMADASSALIELKHACAFCFVGVLVTIGAARWNEMSHAFTTLTSDTDATAQLPLAYALPEIAKCLGPTLSEEVLLPFFQQCVESPNETLGIAVLTEYDGFVAALPAQVRDRCVSDIIETVKKGKGTYRSLLSVVERVGDVAVHVTEVCRRGVLASFLVSAAEHPVNEVLLTAAYAFAMLLMWPDERLVGAVLSFHHSERHHQRILFVNIVQQCVEAGLADLVETHFLRPVKVLAAKECSPNVRLAMARLVVFTLAHSPKFAGQAITSHLQQVLSLDADADVSEQANAHTQKVIDSRRLAFLFRM